MMKKASMQRAEPSDPEGSPPPPLPLGSPFSIEQIEARSTPEPNTGCWLWVGEQTPKGYARVEIRGRRYRVNRLAYEAAHGALPADRMACHTCNNRPCVNPAHLYAGTAKQNFDDMVRVRGQPKMPKHSTAALQDRARRLARDEKGHFTGWAPR